MATQFRMLQVVFQVVGRRTFWSFALVSALVVALLATVSITSRYAMQRYVADQIERMPWDLSIYQTADVALSGDVRDAAAKVGGVGAAERLFFLRTIPPYAVKPVIDNQELRSPWLSLLSATDPALMPADLRPTGNDAVLVLVGSKAQMGDAFLRLQNRKKFQLIAQPKADDLDVDDDHKHPLGIITISLPIEKVIRVDSTEINRWFLEQTSSPTLVPELGMILVSRWDPDLILKFDAVSRGFIHMHDANNHADLHGSPGEYFPEIIHLLKLDRHRLVSGWDIEGSLQRIIAVGSRLTDNVQDTTASAAVDHSLGTMFIRMHEIAQRIALISLLVSQPLLMMAGILLGNLSSLLLLNERRKLGLLRLRGVPATLIRRTLLLSIGGGGLIGGIAGALLGTAFPLLFYFGEIPPLDLVPKIQDPRYLVLFIVVGTGIALLSGRRFIAQAQSVSPLDASRRVATSDQAAGGIRFGFIEQSALFLGGIKVIGWISGVSLASLGGEQWLSDLDRALDFVAFPLFVYGCVALIASRAKFMTLLVTPTAWLLAGQLRDVSLKHLQIRRHRAQAFLLITALMTSLALYPTVMTAVFDNKTQRGARVQLGSDMQVTLNALDLMPAEAQARGGLNDRLAALKVKLDPQLQRLNGLPQVKATTFMVEGLVEGLYMPDRGFSGLPMYVLPDPERYLQAVYAEPGLGQGAPFDTIIRRAQQGRILASASVGAFYKRALEQPMPIGRTTGGKLERLPFGGSINFLPGVPLRTVNDREGFVSARVDYLNQLFTNSPYLIGGANTQALADLDVLIPRVVLTVTASGNGTPEELRKAVLGALDVPPLDVRDLQTEVSRLGSDMYIYLARQNVQIYLVGGLLLALIGIFAVAYANYVEDRRTLALLRIRGAGPIDVVRFFMPNVLGPSLIGLVIGSLIALAVGFGITKLVWELRQLQTVMNYLPTRLAISSQTVAIFALLVVLLMAIVGVFAHWVFSQTARQGLSES